MKKIMKDTKRCVQMSSKSTFYFCPLPTLDRFFNFCVDLVQIIYVSKNGQMQVSHAVP